MLPVIKQNNNYINMDFLKEFENIRQEKLTNILLNTFKHISQCCQISSRITITFTWIS